MTRFYLAVFYSGVAAFYTYRIVYLKNHLAQDMVFPGSRFCASWWNHMSFRFFRGLIWLVCLIRLVFPGLDNYLGIINSLQILPVVLTGNILLTGGFAFSILVHYKMGSQWRSGIDPCGPETLFTEGFYRISRNPMFLGVAIAQLGFFLALPSIFSGICLVVGLATLYRQTLEEEKHLLAIFEDHYSNYQNTVPRWL